MRVTSGTVNSIGDSLPDLSLARAYKERHTLLVHPYPFSQHLCHQAARKRTPDLADPDHRR
jgi:hypothetical protein